MENKLVRVGTVYVPVLNVKLSSDWYVSNLGATLNYIDEEKAILDMANQSFFLVKSKERESLNFLDVSGSSHFALTFEVNGVEALYQLHHDFSERGIIVSEIENRGHAGRNFVFQDPDGNRFDVWSELSPIFKEKGEY